MSYVCIDGWITNYWIVVADLFPFSSGSVSQLSVPVKARLANHQGHLRRYRCRSFCLTSRSCSRFSISTHPFLHEDRLICRYPSLPLCFSVVRRLLSWLRPTWLKIYHFDGVWYALGGKANLVECELLVHVIFELIVVLFSLAEHIHTSLFVHFLCWPFGFLWFLQQVFGFGVQTCHGLWQFSYFVLELSSITDTLACCSVNGIVGFLGGASGAWGSYFFGGAGSYFLAAPNNLFILKI